MKASAMLLTALLASSSALALTPRSERDVDAVARRDRELNALIAGHDAAAAKAYYDDQFVLTTSSGKSKSKDDLLAEIARPDLVLEVNETTDVAVRVRKDTAVLTGVLHQRGRLGDAVFDVRLLVTDTWVMVDGQWVILAGHASRAP